MDMKKAMQWLVPGAAVLLVDQLTKGLLDGVNAPLIPGVIALRGVRNTGMALSLFPGGAAVIVLASLALVGGCIYLLRDLRLGGLAPLSLSLMAGGAVGNMIDRLVYGAVIDFFELLFMDFYIFNVADVGVVVGAVLCGVSLLFRLQDWSKR